MEALPSLEGAVAARLGGGGLDAEKQGGGSSQSEDSLPLLLPKARPLSPSPSRSSSSSSSLGSSAAPRFQPLSSLKGKSSGAQQRLVETIPSKISLVPSGDLFHPKGKVPGPGKGALPEMGFREVTR